MPRMDKGVKKSISDISQRVENERISLLEQIEYFLSKRFPSALKDSDITIESFRSISKSMGIDMNFDNSIQEMILSYTQKLNVLKENLNNMELTGNELPDDSSMQEAQELLDLLDPALEEEKSNLISLLNTSITEGIKRIKQIQELREKKAYLQGKLDNTIMKKRRTAIEQEIEDINNEINELENISFETTTFKERITNIDNGGVPTQQPNSKEVHEELDLLLPFDEEK